MPQRGFGGKPDSAAGGDETKRKVGLKAIAGADEVLVEAARGDGVAALHGEISRHDVAHVATAVVAEVKLEVVLRLLEVPRLFSRLKDLSDDRPRLRCAVRAFMRGDQSRRRFDVVIQIENDRRRRGQERLVHGVRNRRGIEPDETDAPFPMPPCEGFIRLGALIDDDDGLWWRVESEQTSDCLDDNRTAVVGRDGHRDHACISVSPYASAALTPSTPRWNV